MGAPASPYAHRPLDFVEKIESLTDFDAICAAISEELAWYGFSCVTSFMMPGPGEPQRNCVQLNTRPQGYLDHYVENNYVLRDPLVTELRNTVQPFSWSDVVERRDLTRADRRIVEEADEFDVNNGLVVPIVTLSGSLSVFSPCGRDPDLSPDARRAVELISLYSHQALKRVLVDRMRSSEAHTPLTPREREVMHWIAAGKSDHEVAAILNISAGTVNLHVERAKRKLDAFRRTFAVVKAIRLGEISL
ncbi:MAG: LuxR family transcriptional regulator [Methyloceanibacter sp.]|nr:LuxR family transcriptional regulator [Methyloceanibacter sp.]